MQVSKFDVAMRNVGNKKAIMLPVVGTRLHVYFLNLTLRVEIFVVNILRLQNGCDRRRAN